MFKLSSNVLKNIFVTFLQFVKKIKNKIKIKTMTEKSSSIRYIPVFSKYM